MYNIYQSSRRKQIQYEVYAKDYTTIRLFDTDYVATVKEKKLWPLSIRWIQVLWIEFPNNQEYIKQEIATLKRSLSKQFGTVFLQLGIINELIQFDNYQKQDEWFAQQIKKQRLTIQQRLASDYGLVPSRRENMPLSNIVYAVQKSDDQLLSEMNKWCRERVKKGIKKDIGFRLAREDEYEFFYNKWLTLSWKKWFHPISKKQYYDLIAYMQKNNNGALFVASYEDDIIAGSVCVYDADRITYLYGFADRKYSNIGWHHFLKFKIFGRAREQGIAICDMMGAAPTWFPDHPLAGVSKFKESLGGTKIEVWGNYDLVFQPVLYRVMKKIFLWRKK